MNNELLGLRRVLLLSFVMIIVGVASLIFYVFGDMRAAHPFIGLALFIVGTLLFRYAYLKVLSLSFMDDGWEYLGDHCYCLERYKEIPTGEMKAVDKGNYEFEGWIYLGNGMYCRQQDIEDRDAEIKRRKESDDYMKERGFKNLPK